MRLPTENTLTLADDNDRLVIDASDLPAPEVAAVEALLPAYAREGESRMRQAMLGAWLATVNYLWARVGLYLAAQKSPRFAAGAELDAWQPLVQRSRIGGESDAEYRARLLTTVERVTPRAIETIVNELVGEVTPVKAALLEPATDAAFCAPLDGCPWASFLQPRRRRLWNQDPTSEHAQAGVYLVPALTIPQFWIVLPGDAGDDSLAPRCVAEDGGKGDTEFLCPANAEWNFTPPTPDSLMERIKNEVEQRRAAGVTWFAFQDPYLEGAR